MLKEQNKSEVACLLAQIGNEYNAAKCGLSGLAQGYSRHSFITARMEMMEKLREEVEKLVGKDAIAVVADYIDTLPS